MNSTRSSKKNAKHCGKKNKDTRTKWSVVTDSESVNQAWRLELSNIKPRKRIRIKAYSGRAALPKEFSQRYSAMPPDVRKRSALPSIGSMNLGLRPKTWA